MPLLIFHRLATAVSLRYQVLESGVKVFLHYQFDRVAVRHFAGKIKRKYRDAERQRFLRGMRNEKTRKIRWVDFPGSKAIRPLPQYYSMTLKV